MNESATALEQTIARVEADSGLAPGEAAPGVAEINVQPVNAPEHRPLYAPRIKVYPKLARGTFRNIKWAVMAITLSIYYLLPWLRWDRGPHLPNQAVLIDFPGTHFYFFSFEIWAQELYFVVGLLVAAALALFLVNALAGRVWCGYACPQTVWTDLMIWVERGWQGDRNARMRLDKQPWTFNKIWRKTGTHASWVLIAIATGGALVFYFADAPTLIVQLVTGEAPMIAYLFVGIFAGTTYLLGGIAREQVCTYMCPWPRIQGAMFDRDSLMPTYRYWRGEPRGPKHKTESWDGRGDCIDCKTCVAVCPTGIDIREGPQLECIQCALCIDGCNSIMDKVGRPRGLIGYDTFRNIDAVTNNGARAPVQLVRSRTIAYGVLLGFVLALMVGAWFLRTDIDVNIQRDRNPVYVTLSDGGVRNGYTLKILNKRYDTRTVRIDVEGLPEARLSTVGLAGDEAVVSVEPDDVRTVRLFVAVPREGLRQLKGGTADVHFVLTDQDGATQTRHASVFRFPEQR